jgi:hypothetical protein
VPGYISVVVMKWLLVFYVRMSVHKRGMRLRDLVGGRWATPKEVMEDTAIGAASKIRQEIDPPLAEISREE